MYKGDFDVDRKDLDYQTIREYYDRFADIYMTTLSVNRVVGVSKPIKKSRYIPPYNTTEPQNRGSVYVMRMDVSLIHRSCQSGCPRRQHPVSGVGREQSWPS